MINKICSNQKKKPKQTKIPIQQHSQVLRDYWSIEELLKCRSLIVTRKNNYPLTHNSILLLENNHQYTVLKRRKYKILMKLQLRKMHFSFLTILLVHQITKHHLRQFSPHHIRGHFMSVTALITVQQRKKEGVCLQILSCLFYIFYVAKNPITHKKMQVKCSHLKSSLISSDLRSLYKNVLFPFSSQEKMFQKQHIKKYSMSLKLEQKMFYRLTNIVMNLHNLN